MPSTVVPITVNNASVPLDRPMTPAEQGYTAWLQDLRRTYLDYPWVIGLETLARCNATCHFCPYPNMERAGERMSDELIAKVLRDLGDIPREVPFRINFTRVNEPFLDKRIVDVMLETNRLLTNAKIALYTNGSAFTPALLDKLTKVEKIEIFNVSLNAHEPGLYKRIMGLPFERTAANIDMLHERASKGEMKFDISVSRVADGSDDDRRFEELVKTRWPRFRTAMPNQIDWIGTVDVPQVAPIPKLSCVQWFGLHLIASGRDALCVIDHDARHGFGNVADTHLLELYNHPARRAQRERITERQFTSPCRGCAYWG